MSSDRTRKALLALATIGWICPAIAQVPGEINNVTVNLTSTIQWDADASADDYNIYRGRLTTLLTGGPVGSCHANEVIGTSYVSPGDPLVDDGYFYFVTGENASGEGSAGTADGGPREYSGCEASADFHMLNRLGYGWGEWSADRLTTLGVQGYVDEQLDPVLIDDASNTDLTTRLAPYDPPTTIEDLRRHAVIRGVYSRRQLEQTYTMFLTNHFNTQFVKIRDYFISRGIYDDTMVDELTVETQYREMNRFRDLGFNGTFRDMVEESGLGPAMLVYLDNYKNTGDNPNENFARELMELHTMGVDNGYTQLDVEEMSRVWSGWQICKKTPANAADPLAVCISREFEDTTPGSYVANFREDRHDCTAKTLFLGTPYEINFPDTCGNPFEGVNEVYDAMDAVVEHPSTPRYLSEKMLIWFVDEQPTTQMIDLLEAEWMDAGNPAGEGDMREVLRAALNMAEMRSPDTYRNKLKTPLELINSMVRALRGQTDGDTQVRGFLNSADHRIHEFEDPTGFPERGDDWLDTTLMLETQKVGLDFAPAVAADFGNDLIALMADNGVTSASTPTEIVDFWATILYGSSFTEAERQEVITYLTTDDAGAPTAVNDDRVRDTVGFMLGLGQFFEQ